jgi:hypothetical protein
LHASPPPRKTASSWANGVDVAKDAADILLREHTLAVLHQGILEGRKAFANVMKYLLMGTSSNFGNMFSMAGAVVFLPFLPMLPDHAPHHAHWAQHPVHAFGRDAGLCAAARDVFSVPR